MTDAQQALAQVREALADEALFDDGASACDTLLAVRHFERVCTLDNIAAILAHVEAQAAEIKRLRKLAMTTHLFEEAPCFLCGYNGPGYYKPEQHPCAALYHEAMEEQR